MIFHFSQQNTQLSVQSYNIEIAQHKHTITTQNKIKQDKQLKRVGSTFLISYDPVTREIWQKA
jgi:hypothetical protein